MLQNYIKYDTSWTSRHELVSPPRVFDTVMVFTDEGAAHALRDQYGQLYVVPISQLPGAAIIDTTPEPHVPNAFDSLLPANIAPAQPCTPMREQLAALLVEPAKSATPKYPMNIEFTSLAFGLVLAAFGVVLAKITLMYPKFCNECSPTPPL